MNSHVRGFIPTEEQKIGDILSDSDSDIHKEDITPKAKEKEDPDLLRFYKIKKFLFL